MSKKFFCPSCQCETKILYTRPGGPFEIRRRRNCRKCNNSFTTYERISAESVYVLGRDGSRTHFDKQKLASNLLPVLSKFLSDAVSQEFVERIALMVERNGSAEIAPSVIRRMVIDELQKIRPKYGVNLVDNALFSYEIATSQNPIGEAHEILVERGWGREKRAVKSIEAECFLKEKDIAALYEIDNAWSERSLTRISQESENLVLLENDDTIHRFPVKAWQVERFGCEVATLKQLGNLIAGIPFMPPIPNVVAIHQRPFGLAYHRLNGVTLRAAWDRFREHEKLEVGRALGKYLATLHSLDASDFPHLDDGLIQDTQKYLQGRLGEAEESDETPDWLRQAVNYGLRSINWLISHPTKERPCLVHGDFHRSNVLVDGTRITAVLDWTQTFVGDLHWDFRCMREFKVKGLWNVIKEEYESSSGRQLEDERLKRVWAVEAAIQAVHDYLMNSGKK